jgi:hypothetical protein
VKAIKMRRLLAASALMVFATVVPGSAEAVPTLNRPYHRHWHY